MKTLITFCVGALLANSSFSAFTARAQGLAPVITSFSPVTDTNGAPVTIRGENLQNVTKVTFGSVEAPFTEFSSTRLFTEVPAKAVSGPITVFTAAGQVTSAESFTVINVNAPGLTGFSPGEGAPGTPVQMQGTNLTTATSVKFNGIEASFTVNADVLFATVPAAATSGPITITTPEGATTSAASFTVLKSQTAPVITDFKPKSGEAGATVQISGSNLTGVTSVTFNGVPAAFRMFAGLLIATVPPGATTGPVKVVSPAGADTSEQVFTVTSLPPPTIADFNPKSGPPGTSVTIEGNNLINVTAVRFTGVNANFSVFGGSLLATVPANAASGPITVVTTAGTATTTALFTVTEVPRPTITDFSPLSGEAGAQVEIHGANLAEATSVRFNGVEGVFTVLAGSVFVAVPTNAVSGPITIITPAGQVTSATSFTVLQPAEESTIITDFVPTSGAVGDTVLIHGTNLVNVLAVKFNGVDAVFTNAFSTLISAIVPTNAASGPITVFTATSTNATPGSFTVTNAVPPVLAGVDTFSPTNGVAGATVEIRGTNLMAVTEVRFNGVEADYTIGSDTAITAKVPAGAITGPITLTTAAGTVATENSFQVDAGPNTPPTLDVLLAAAGQVEISWSDDAKDFVLQESENASDARSWRNVAIPPLHSNGTFRLTVAAATGLRFYRLVHP